MRSSLASSWQPSGSICIAAIVTRCRSLFGSSHYSSPSATWSRVWNRQRRWWTSVSEDQSSSSTIRSQYKRTHAHTHVKEETIRFRHVAVNRQTREKNRQELMKSLKKAETMLESGCESRQQVDDKCEKKTSLNGRQQETHRLI